MKSLGRALFALGLSLGAVRGQAAEEPAFPLRPSANGRYLVDQGNRPFFYQADSPWVIVKNLTLPEVEEYLDARKAQGFTAIQVHAISKELSPATDRAGKNPFDPIDDILKPVDAYWDNVERIIAAAAARHMLVGMSASWIQWGGRDKTGWRFQISESTAGPYGRFLATRFRRFNNLIWILGGDANPIEVTGAIDEMGKAIHEGAPHQLIGVHNRPEYASSAFFDATSWLGLNLAYTYRETYIHVLGEYYRLGKVRPIILSESGYELESNDKRGGTPHRVRRQAYEALLSGAFGGHAYGHRDVWKVDLATVDDREGRREKWRDALSAPGGIQMRNVRSFFTSKEWYRLLPDQDGSLVAGGRGYFGEDDYVVGGVAEDSSFAMIYIPQSREIQVNLSRLRGPVSTRWFDPVSGRFEPAEGSPTPHDGIKTFGPPGRNAGGDSDFALLLVAATK
jgi:hypothetical protein